jgi:hypothetical protein
MQGSHIILHATTFFHNYHFFTTSAALLVSTAPPFMESFHLLHYISGIKRSQIFFCILIVYTKSSSSLAISFKLAVEESSVSFPSPRSIFFYRALCIGYQLEMEP